MTYNEKKSLYESIMMETAKTVKRMINESAEYELRKDLPKEEFNKHAQLNAESAKLTLKTIVDFSNKLIQKYPIQSNIILSYLSGIVSSMMTCHNEKDLIKKLEHLRRVSREYDELSMGIDFEYLKKHDII